MKTVRSIVTMAIDGHHIAGETAMNWYDIARDAHIEAIRGIAGISLETVTAYSALASYNASPNRQSQVVATWLFLGRCELLPNAQTSWDQWRRFGWSELRSSKAECYRRAMLEGSRSDSIVLDRHMLNALGDPGRPLPYSASPVGENDAYNRATDRCLQAARILGISGCQLQAMVWYWQTSKNGMEYGKNGVVDILRHSRGAELCVA